MGPRLVAAGDEEGLLCGDRLQGLCARFHPLDPGGVGRGSQDDKIIVHQGDPFGSVALGDEFLLQGFGMGHDEIHVSLLGDLQGGAGAGADVADPDARFLLELILQGPHDPRVDGADGARHEDKAAFLRPAKTGHEEQETQKHQ